MRPNYFSLRSFAVFLGLLSLARLTGAQQPEPFYENRGIVHVAQKLRRAET